MERKRYVAPWDCPSNAQLWQNGSFGIIRHTAAIPASTTKTQSGLIFS